MTSWKHLVAYKCKRCGEDCLNDHRKSRARARECRDCHYIPDLDLARESGDSDHQDPEVPSGGPNESGAVPKREAGRTPQRDRRPARKPGSPERPEAASPAARTDGSAVESPELWFDE